MKRFGIALSALLATALPVKAASITYNINEVTPIFTVTGTITTDGTLGGLFSPNITDWSVTIFRNGTPNFYNLNHQTGQLANVSSRPHAGAPPSPVLACPA
jgi:uncharacterized membrane protein